MFCSTEFIWMKNLPEHHLKIVHIVQITLSLFSTIRVFLHSVMQNDDDLYAVVYHFSVWLKI